MDFFVGLLIFTIWNLKTSNSHPVSQSESTVKIQPGDFPFHCIIRIKPEIDEDFLLCECAIIDKTWAVTAAGCVDKYKSNPEILEIVAGIDSTENIESQPHSQKRRVKRIETPPSWTDSKKKSGNIALMKAKKRFQLNKYVKVATFGKNSTENETFELVGFGVGQEITKIPLKKISSGECLQKDDNPSELFCAKENNSTNVFRNESFAGGPMAKTNTGRRKEIIAIYSAEHPGLFTDIAFYKEWIKKETKIDQSNTRSTTSSDEGNQIPSDSGGGSNDSTTPSTNATQNVNSEEEDEEESLESQEDSTPQASEESKESTEDLSEETTETTSETTEEKDDSSSDESMSNEESTTETPSDDSTDETSSDSEEETTTESKSDESTETTESDEETSPTPSPDNSSEESSESSEESDESTTAAPTSTTSTTSSTSAPTTTSTTSSPASTTSSPRTTASPAPASTTNTPSPTTESPGTTSSTTSSPTQTTPSSSTTASPTTPDSTSSTPSSTTELPATTTTAQPTASTTNGTTTTTSPDDDNSYYDDDENKNAKSHTHNFDQYENEAQINSLNSVDDTNAVTSNSAQSSNPFLISSFASKAKNLVSSFKHLKNFFAIS